MAQLQNTTISNSFTLPTGTINQRPGSPSTGTVRFNTTTNRAEFYDGSFWKPGDGASQQSPFDKLTDLCDLGYSGIQTLWTTLDSQLSSPIRVDVDFEIPGGPWYVISFNFPGSGDGGWDRINNTCAFSSNSNTNHWLNNSNRRNRQVRLPYTGLGEDYQTKIWNGVRYTSTLSANSEGWYRYDVGGNLSPKYTISYYNHGEGSNFLSAEVNALRNIVTILCERIPHQGMECDAQLSGSSSGPWYGSPFTVGGHAFWIQDRESNWLRVVPNETSSDETGSCYSWTRDEFDAYSWAGASGPSYFYNGGTYRGLYTNGLILPEFYQMSGTTGGTAGFGTPYVNKNGLNNIRNSRRYFLVK